MTDLFDFDGKLVATMTWDAGTTQSIIYGTRLFQRQIDGRYVETAPGAQATLPLVAVPLIRRNEDPSF